MKNKETTLFVGLLFVIFLSFAFITHNYVYAGDKIPKTINTTIMWTNGFAITPSDSTDLAINARGIYVGVGGDIAVVLQDGTTLTFKNATSGSMLPVMAKRINATATTATNLLGGI